MVIVQGEQRTVTFQQLADLFRQGAVTEGSYVWREGMGDWLPISSLPELRAALPSPEPSEVSALEMSPSGAHEIDDSMPTTMLQSPVAEAPAPRPAPAPAPRPAPGPAPAPAIAPGPASGPAARRPGPERPDLLASAAALDPGLAQAAGQVVPAANQPRPMLQNQGGQLVFAGGQESSMMNQSTAFFMAHLNSPGRKKKIFAIAGAGVVALAVTGVLVVRALDSKEKSAVEKGWTDLQACLLGEPLKERETVTERIRNIQLSVVGTPIERRAKPGQQGWPLRCAPLSHELSEHAKAVGGEYAPIQTTAEALSKALLADASAAAGFSEQAEKLWADGAKAKLKAGAIPAGAAAAPKPAAAMGYEAFVALPKFLSGGFSVLNVRPAAPGSQAAFVIDQQDLTEGPQVCSAGPTGNVKCSKAPAAAVKLSPGLRLSGHVEDGARPFLFAGDHGQSGILRADNGETTTSAYVLGAYSRKDGSLWALTRGGSREAKLLHVSPTGSRSERAGARDLGGDAIASASLVGGWLAYRTGPKASPASKLVFRKLGDKNEEPAAAIEAGDIEEAPPSEPEPIRKPGRKAAPPPSPEADDERAVASCRFEDTLAVRLHGQKGDAVSVFQAGRWSPPLKSPPSGGAFTCRKGEAASTKVTPVMEQDKNWASISHVKCSLAGCNATTVTMKDLLPGLVEAAPIDDKSAIAVDVDGKLLVVWNAGYVGGIRMRIAPPGQLKDVEDIVLIDARDPKNAMKLTAITEMKLVPAGTSALLFLGGPTGARALRIEGSGAFAPVTAGVQ